MNSAEMQRTHFTAGYTLYNCVYEKKKKIAYLFFSKPISDYGKMLKYREKYWLTDISVELFLKSVVL